MNTEKIIKETKVIILVTFAIGLIMMIIGIIFSLLDINLINNNKAIVGLSFIPLSLAFTYYIKLKLIIKTPNKMKKIIINENDERIVASKNKADARAFRIIQSILFLSYMGYTLIIPEDIFKSIGWWILLALLLISFGLQSIFYSLEMKKND